MQVAQFMRDLMVTQRDGKAATFNYTTRGWNLKVFALNVPFTDSVTETVRELELEFKVQQDVSGITTANALKDAVSLFADGIGWGQSIYNNVLAAEAHAVNTGDSLGEAGGFLTPFINAVQVVTANIPGIPGG